MSSPITLSNFNSIDFSSILNAVMAQASQPLTALQSKQADISTESSQYGVLATKLGTLETAAAGLSTPSAVTTFSSTLSQTGAIGVTATGDAVPGTYDVIVHHLAKTQVTASSTTAADADTTTVCDAGTLTIGGVAVNVSGPLTLSGLASAINNTANIAVRASVVESAHGAFRLVLTGTDSGLANAFAITTVPTGGTGVAFADPNAQEADDSSVSVNGLAITSSSNTLTSAIPGTTLSLLHGDGSTTTVTVAADDSALTAKVKSVIAAYNDFIKFIGDQGSAAANGVTGTLAHEAILNQARSALRTGLTNSYGTGTFTHLAEVGIGFDQTGKMVLDQQAFTSALSQDRDSVAALFTGSSQNGGFTDGAFGTVQSALDEFTKTGGFVAAAQTQLTGASARLDKQIADMQDRLAAQRITLQQQFTAADQAMTQLKSQSGTLSSMSVTQG